MVIDDVAMDSTDGCPFSAVTFTKPTQAYNEGTRLGLFCFSLVLPHKHALNKLQVDTPFFSQRAHIKIGSIFRRGKPLGHTQISQSQL